MKICGFFIVKNPQNQQQPQPFPNLKTKKIKKNHHFTETRKINPKHRIIFEIINF